MCGIAGIAAAKGRQVASAPIGAATDTLSHRGPDASATYLNEEGTVALGHRRLCIIDLSPAAAQPMAYGGRYTIVHNGELYNYLELRSELRRQGYTFASASDTEVIAAAYDAWGRGCLQRFDGAFAFAIWDEREGALFIARDRFGEKPLFFHYDEDQLHFASEMKALWAMGIPRQVNRRLLYNFLTIGYTANPFDPQETFYEGIQKLPPASFLHYSLHSGELRMETYWQVSVEVAERITEGEAIEQFTHLFRQSLTRRLRSDVPVGTSLSGGLDSSSIVAFCDGLAADHYTHKCFTASFPGFERDELKYATQVAAQYGLEHHVVSIAPEEVPALLQKVARHQEEPFASASVLAQFKVYEATKGHGVTVLLDGQGADEVLAGYHKYYKWYLQELYRQKRLGSSGELRAARALGITEPFGWKNKAAALFPHFGASLLQSSKAREAARHPDLAPEFAYTHKRGFYYSTPTQFDLNGVLYYNTFVYGLEELLRFADRNSMANATEVRLPFLSHELVSFLFTLPPHFKIHEGWTKWLLRKSADTRLPHDVAWRRDKVGFEPPQKQWMQHPAVAEAIHEGKKALVHQGILSPTALTKKIKPHDAHAAQSFEWRYWSSAQLFT